MSTEARLDLPCGIALLIGQLTHGGSERQLFLFLRDCNREKWQPTVFVSGELGCWEESIRSLGIPIVQLVGGRLAKLHQFRRECENREIKVMFSWSSYTNGFSLGLVGTGIHCIGSFRNSVFADLPQKMRRLWAWASVSGPSVLVCNSRSTSQALGASNPRKPIYFVPNAVEMIPDRSRVVARNEWRSRLDLTDDTVLVVGVGRLSAQKNFHRFIGAIGNVPGDRPVRAVIAGRDFGERAGLEEQVASAGLAHRVSFLGEVPDARRLICAGDVFLLSSDHEGTPNVLLEAMAAGVPCVATAVDGVREIIEHEQNGLLADPDAMALAEAINRLLDDSALRRRIAASALAWVARYSHERVSEQLWKICEGANPNTG
jgi:glycosyltransferase involved in cell wall biosynthesis